MKILILLSLLSTSLYASNYIIKLENTRNIVIKELNQPANVILEDKICSDLLNEDSTMVSGNYTINYNNRQYETYCLVELGFAWTKVVNIQANSREHIDPVEKGLVNLKDENNGFFGKLSDQLIQEISNNYNSDILFVCENEKAYVSNCNFDTTKGASGNCHTNWAYSNDRVALQTTSLNGSHLIYGSVIGGGAYGCYITGSWSNSGQIYIK